MTTYCSVDSCQNRVDRDHVFKGISYHKFPLNPMRKEKWINAIRALGKTDIEWSPLKRSIICSHHFRDEDYNKKNGKRTKLKTDAIPRFRDLNQKNAEVVWEREDASSSDSADALLEDIDVKEQRESNDSDSENSPDHACDKSGEDYNVDEDEVTDENDKVDEYDEVGSSTENQDYKNEPLWYIGQAESVGAVDSTIEVETFPLPTARKVTVVNVYGEDYEIDQIESLDENLKELGPAEEIAETKREAKLLRKLRLKKKECARSTRLLKTMREKHRRLEKRYNKLLEAFKTVKNDLKREMPCDNLTGSIPTFKYSGSTRQKKKHVRKLSTDVSEEHNYFKDPDAIFA